MHTLDVKLQPRAKDVWVKQSLSWVMASAIIQFALDILLEVLIASGVVSYLPLNWAFLSLVVVSATTATFSALDISHGNFVQERHEIATTMLIECLLLALEIENVIAKFHDYPHVLHFRMFFIVATGLNVVLLVCTWIHLEKVRHKGVENAAQMAANLSVRGFELHAFRRDDQHQQPQPTTRTTRATTTTSIDHNHSMSCMDHLAVNENPPTARATSDDIIHIHACVYEEHPTRQELDAPLSTTGAVLDAMQSRDDLDGEQPQVVCLPSIIIAEQDHAQQIGHDTV